MCYVRCDAQRLVLFIKKMNFGVVTVGSDEAYPRPPKRLSIRCTIHHARMNTGLLSDSQRVQQLELRVHVLEQFVLTHMLQTGQSMPQSAEPAALVQPIAAAPVPTPVHPSSIPATDGSAAATTDPIITPPVTAAPEPPLPPPPLPPHTTGGGVGPVRRPRLAQAAVVRAHPYAPPAPATAPPTDPPTTATEPTNTAFEQAAVRAFWQDIPALSSVPAHYVTALNLPRQVKGGKSREYLNGLGEGHSIEECLHYFATQFTRLRMPKIRRIRTSVGPSEAAFWLGYMTSTANPRIGKPHPWLYFVDPQQQQQ